MCRCLFVFFCSLLEWFFGSTLLWFGHFWPPSFCNTVSVQSLHRVACLDLTDIRKENRETKCWARYTVLLRNTTVARPRSSTRPSRPRTRPSTYLERSRPSTWSSLPSPRSSTSFLCSSTGQGQAHVEALTSLVRYSLSACKQYPSTRLFQFGFGRESVWRKLKRGLVIERSRVRVSPTVLSSTPLMRTCLCHQAVEVGTSGEGQRCFEARKVSVDLERRTGMRRQTLQYIQLRDQRSETQMGCFG